MYFAYKRDEAHNKRMLVVDFRHQRKDYVFWNKKWRKYARWALRYLGWSVIIATIGLALAIGEGVQQIMKKGKKAQPSHVTHHNTERVDMTEAFEEQEKLMWIEIRDTKR
jgi:hypothetical protein